MKTISGFFIVISFFLIGCPANHENLNSNNNVRSADTKTGRLSLETGLIYKTGDVKPIARQEFLLLDTDAETILKESGFKRPGKLEKMNVSYLQTYSGAIRCATNLAKTCPIKELAFKIISQADEALKTHTVQKLKTGFDGKAEFINIPYGNYFLMGTYTSQTDSLQWNEPVTVNSDSIKIIFDQNNIFLR